MTNRLISRIAAKLMDLHVVAKMRVMRTDERRWERNAHETPAWDGRNRLFATMIVPGSSVLDLGAGAQTLRSYLVDCEYQPCDIVRGAGVLYCDYNRDIYPAVKKIYDVTVCSGVLEYVRHPKKFILSVTPFGRQGLLSYAVVRPDRSKMQRMREGWVNHLKQSELEEIFTTLSLQWQLVNVWDQQLIYRIAMNGMASDNVNHE